MKNYKNFIIHEFDQLESSNKTAFEMAENGKIFENEIILAKTQTAGKGRKDRNWVSPQGNLYFSLVLKPKIAIEKIHQISFLAICALQIVVEKLVEKNVEVKNKWPNDLLINNKKCAGILLQSKLNEKNCEFVILGIGLNLVSSPDNVIFEAGNLKEFNVETSPNQMLEKFLDEFEKIYQNYLDFSFKNIRNLWLKNAYKLGEEILIKLDEKEIKGIFEDLDEDGNLILENKNFLEKISFGDVC